MKMTNAQIINTLNAINGFTEKKLPQKISYAISKNHLALENEYKFYQESLTKLIKSYEEYFVKDEDGEIKFMQNGIPEITPPHDAEFTEELAELLSVEVEITPYKISEDVFDYDDSKFDPLSPSEIEVLILLLCEEEK